MSQIYNGNTKRPQMKENQPRILQIHVILSENSQRDLSMRIHPKSCPIFLPKVAATLLSGSRKGTVGA